MYSHLPVYVCNPSVTPPNRIERILFATDGSEASKIGFKAVLDLAKDLNAQVTVYYKTHGQVAIAFPYAPNLYPYLEEEIRSMRKTLKEWTEMGTAQGVKVDSKLDDSDTRLAHSIVEYSKEGAYSMIAMVAQSGPVASVFLGSTTREVLRHSTLPVWVLPQMGRS